MDISINHQEVYIDKMTGLTVDLTGTRNADQLEVAIPLTVKVAA